MDELQEKEKAILYAALSFDDAPKRKEYLDAACQDNPGLRQQINSLLAADEGDDSFMRQPAADPIGLPTEEYQEGQSQVIGRYKLLQKIGEGGFGSVYMAEQQEPVIRRVALKIIKLGMDTKQVIARFEAERQALAMMDHPNIAKVLDAGATDTGRPYFVMELVRGVTVTDYCDEQKLTTQERLRLFMDICGAIQHAHQKGIIHRDIKPTNVLVSLHAGKAVPKIIDFGIAKATQQRLTDKTLFTRFDQFIGTPVYMSPEQVEMSGLDIDTRSDIYSLGVLLYEFLTGRPPFDPEELRKAGYDAMRQRIRDEEPCTPSSRLKTLPRDDLTTVANNRRTDPTKLESSLRGDLDWIVMKAMQKDRAHRYETAHNLSTDVSRYLDDVPIEARPPSVGYRIEKILRRNKAAILTAAVISTALVVGTVISTWQAIRATSATRDAHTERDRAVKAEIRAKEEELKTQAALANAKRSAAELAMEKGQLLGEQGDTNLALLWLARSLKLAPTDAVDLQAVIRANLSGWSRHVSPLKSILPVEGRPEAIAFSQDRQTLLVAAKIPGQGIVVNRFHAGTGKPGKAFSLATDRKVTALKLSTEGSTLAMGFADGAVQLVGLNDEQVTELIPSVGPGHRVTALVFSPSSQVLLVAKISPDDKRQLGRVELVDTSRAERLFPEALKHRVSVWAAAFRSDGQAFVTSTSISGQPRFPGASRVWDLNGKQIAPTIMHSSGAMSVAVSPDGKKLLTGHWDSKARLWDLSTGEAVWTRLQDAPVSCVTFSADELGRRMLVGSYDGTVRLWDVITCEPLSPLLTHQWVIRDAILSPDGKQIASCDRDSARIWDVAEHLSSPPMPVNAPRRFPVAFSHDRRAILASREDNSIQLQDALTGVPVAKSFRPSTAPLAGAVSRDGYATVLVGVNRSVEFRNMNTSSETNTPTMPNRQAFSAAVSPDGKTAAAGGWDKAIVWNTETGEILGELSHLPNEGPIFAVMFSPDGRLILTGGADARARIWSADTLSELRVIPHRGYAVAISPDGQLVITGGSSNQDARVWELSTGRSVGLPLRHTLSITSAAFSLDGQTVLTGSMDGYARLWDVATGKLLGPPMKHAGPVARVQFWPDGETLATAGSTAIPLEKPWPVAQYWRLPTPLIGDAERIERWAEVITGMELGASSGFSLLDHATWGERRQQLVELGFPVIASK